MRLDAYRTYLLASMGKILNRSEQKTVATNAGCSYLYALEILKGPFPLGERMISQDPGLSMAYAKNVLKSAFPPGEGAIAIVGHYALHYAIEVLKGPFPQGEDAIFNTEAESTDLTTYILLAATHPDPTHLERLQKYKIVQQLLRAIATK